MDNSKRSFLPHPVSLHTVKLNYRNHRFSPFVMKNALLGLIFGYRNLEFFPSTGALLWVTELVLSRGVSLQTAPMKDVIGQPVADKLLISELGSHPF